MFKDEIRKAADAAEKGNTDHAVNMALDAVYREKGKSSIYMMSALLDRQQKQLEKENLERYKAVQDGVHGMAALGKSILEDGDTKDTAGFYFEGENIAFLINILKTYFPDGNPDGASNYGHWFFDKAVDMIVENSDEYLHGKSESWARREGHYDYIAKIVEENS